MTILKVGNDIPRIAEMLNLVLFTINLNLLKDINTRLPNKINTLTVFSKYFKHKKEVTSSVQIKAKY